LLAKGRRRGALNVVGTVADFGRRGHRSGFESAWAPGEDPWPHMDLLVGNAQEIMGLAGAADPEAAAESLLRRGVAAVVATNGPERVYYRSMGGVFGRSRGYVPA